MSALRSYSITTEDGEEHLIKDVTAKYAALQFAEKHKPWTDITVRVTDSFAINKEYLIRRGEVIEYVVIEMTHAF